MSSACTDIVNYQSFHTQLIGYSPFCLPALGFTNLKSQPLNVRPVNENFGSGVVVVVVHHHHSLLIRQVEG